MFLKTVVAALLSLATVDGYEIAVQLYKAKIECKENYDCTTAANKCATTILWDKTDKFGYGPDFHEFDTCVASDKCGTKVDELFKGTMLKRTYYCDKERKWYYYRNINVSIVFGSILPVIYIVCVVGYFNCATGYWPCCPCDINYVKKEAAKDAEIAPEGDTEQVLKPATEEAKPAKEEAKPATGEAKPFTEEASLEESKLAIEESD